MVYCRTYPGSVGLYLSTPRHLFVQQADQILQIRNAGSPTVHNNLRIIQKIMNYSKGLRHGHASLLLRESVQPL